MKFKKLAKIISGKPVMIKYTRRTDKAFEWGMRVLLSPFELVYRIAVKIAKKGDKNVGKD